MSRSFFASGSANVGGKNVSFTKRKIRDRFAMYIPSSFVEDKNLVSNYTYLFSKDKSPLSIAIRFSSCTTDEEKTRLVSVYFNQAPETLKNATEQDGDVYYRETVTSSKYMSVYSLRFAVEVPGGMLFGCFNCSAEYQDHWRPVVLEMLQNVEMDEE